jgi:ketosteroid isomerase-like protein
MTVVVGKSAKEQDMKSTFFRRFAVLLLFSALVWWASASIRGAAAMGKGGDAPVPSNDPAAIEAIKQLEQDMGNARVAGNIDKLNQIYADDFATVGSSGKVITKESLLNDFKSFHDKLEWFENGPMDVQVFGDVAVACASVKEKRTRNGKDTSGEFVWMDLLEKRAGKWVVVRSAGTRLK